MKIVIIFLVGLVTCQAVSNFDEKGRVTPGRNAELGQFPWQVAIHNEEKYVCLGVLITEKIVLTVVGCVTDAQVATGEVFLHLGSLVAAEFEKSRINVSRIVPDPAAVSVLVGLETDTKIPITSNVLAIKVLTTHQIPENTVAQSSGWGIDNKYISYNLQYVDLNVTWTNTPLAEEAITSVNHPNHACLWDQGTGLVWIDENTSLPMLIGIALKNYESCADPFPASKYISTYSNNNFINLLLDRS